MIIIMVDMMPLHEDPSGKLDLLWEIGKYSRTESHPAMHIGDETTGDFYHENPVLVSS